MARIRVRQLKAEAQQTMGQAQWTLSEALHLIREIMDGFTMTLVWTSEQTPWAMLKDFAFGKLKEFPIGIRITIDE